jgi:hypothetical protein
MGFCELFVWETMNHSFMHLSNATPNPTPKLILKNGFFIISNLKFSSKLITCLTLILEKN